MTLADEVLVRQRGSIVESVDRERLAVELHRRLHAALRGTGQRVLPGLQREIDKLLEPAERGRQWVLLVGGPNGLSVESALDVNVN